MNFNSISPLLDVLLSCSGRYEELDTLLNTNTQNFSFFSSLLLLSCEIRLPLKYTNTSLISMHSDVWLTATGNKERTVSQMIETKSHYCHDFVLSWFRHDISHFVFLHNKCLERKGRILSWRLSSQDLRKASELELTQFWLPQTSNCVFFGLLQTLLDHIWS